MKKNNYLLLVTLIIIVFFISGCSAGKYHRIAKGKQEILEAEKNFEAAVKQDGFAAFGKFAADAAVIKNDNKLVKGKADITAYYTSAKLANVKLTWTPDFVDVSASGDLGYTYGNFTYSVTDSTGKTKDYQGIFHTVWKKQSNGEWKFVWD